MKMRENCPNYLAPLNNITHPFSIWLINNAPDLDEHYTALLNFICSEISTNFGHDNLLETIDNINSILERLKLNDRGIVVPDEILLKESDFAED